MNLGELEFTAEDFGVAIGEVLLPSHIAQIANHILREKLERAEKVFGKNKKIESCGRKLWDIKENKLDTHVARVVCIEEKK